MKNENIIQQRINLIIEYIEQILSDNIVAKSNVNIRLNKINGNQKLTLDIYVPISCFERHFNLDISEENEIEFYKCLLDTLLTRYMESENMGISEYYFLRSEFGGPIFHGVDVSNINNSCIKLSFRSCKKEFTTIVNDYNNRIDNYVNSLKSK